MKLRALLLMLALTQLPACAFYRFEELRNVQPTGTPYQKALAEHYRTFALEEREKSGWFNAVRFADKALAVAYGQEVEPEKISNWRIPSEAYMHMLKAYKDLTDSLTPSLKQAKPQLAADATFSYDCWVKMRDEHRPEADYGPCRNRLFEILKIIWPPREWIAPPAPPTPLAQAPAEKPKPKKMKAEKPKKHVIVVKKKPSKAKAAPPDKKALAKDKAKAKAKDKAKDKGKEKTKAKELVKKKEKLEPLIAKTAKTKETESASYMVFFLPGEAALTPPAKKMVDNAAKSLTSRASYLVVINGRTDTGGSAREFPGLTSSRAQAVKQRLLALGVKASAIDVMVPGEETRSAFNPPRVERKVEIFIAE